MSTETTREVCPKCGTAGCLEDKAIDFATTAEDEACEPTVPDEPMPAEPHMRLLEMAWGVIANAGWDDCAKTPGWQEAAVRWRDDYHRWLDLHLRPGGYRTWEELAVSVTRERDALFAEAAALRRALRNATDVGHLALKAPETPQEPAEVPPPVDASHDPPSSDVSTRPRAGASWRERAEAAQAKLAEIAEMCREPGHASERAGKQRILAVIGTEEEAGHA